jgi:D-3-phosphoglycerate dehydrogenase / 2-oxoglutarate reductase
VTAPIPPVAERLLSELGAVVVSDGGDLRREIAAAEVLVVRGERVDARLIAAGERLRAIARTGSGVDNVDVAAATARGIPVVNAPVAGAQPVAEGVWALIGAAAKRLGELRECIEQERWRERYALAGRDLDGSTLGIVGFGAIGAAVARVGAAFGMRVLAADPAFAPPLDGTPVEAVSLRALVERSDVITLHCPLTDGTRGLIDRELLRRARRAPILVTAARGPVVAGDELLLEALDEGWLSAVALDVFAHEPLPPSSALLRDPRVICTPHSIGLTEGWNERVFASLRHDVGELLRGGVPRHLVNPQVLAGAVAAR